MSLLKNFKQTDAKVSILQGLVGGSIAVIALGAAVVHMQGKQIDELERKVDHIINDMEK